MIEMMEGQVLYLPFPLFGYSQNVPHEIVPQLGSVKLFDLLVETRGNVFRDERKIGLIQVFTRNFRLQEIRITDLTNQNKLIELSGTLVRQTELILRNQRKQFCVRS